MKGASLILILFPIVLGREFVPKQVVKHGLATFVKEIVKPTSEENLCFLVFERIAEAIVDDLSDFDEAFEAAINVDLTHSYSKGICEKAFAKFQSTFEPFRTKNNKVWLGAFFDQIQWIEKCPSFNQFSSSVCGSLERHLYVR